MAEKNIKTPISQQLFDYRPRGSFEDALEVNKSIRRDREGQTSAVACIIMAGC